MIYLMKYIAGLTPGNSHTTADLFTVAAQSTPSNTQLTITFYKDPTITDVELYPIASTNLTADADAWTHQDMILINTGNIDARNRAIWQATLTTQTPQTFIRLKAEN